MSVSPSVGALLQDFFVQYLLRQRRASPQTSAAYRDTFRLLLNFVHQTIRIAPSAFTW